MAARDPDVNLTVIGWLHSAMLFPRDRTYFSRSIGGWVGDREYLPLVSTKPGQ